MTRRVAVFVLALALVATAGLVAWGQVRDACWFGDRICEGIRIAGEPLPAGAALEPFVLDRQRALAQRSVRVVVEDVADLAQTYTLEELGVRMDAERVVGLARAVGHTGRVSDRIEEARRARRGEVDIPFALSVDLETAARTLAPLKDAADELAIPAKLDIVKRTVVPETPGHFLDLDALFERVREVALGGVEPIRVRRAEVEPRISSDLLARIDTHALLARYKTGFSRAGDQASRAQNIENGAARLDGVVLMPGELFSLNAAVGPRTVDNGFTKGWEIWKGEMVEGIGGGTCQVASTLHAAAVFAGLDILERLPHSRPSAYITMGLDATVVYPVVDLKLRNPFAFPVVVHGFVDGNVVTFELYGKEKTVRVVFGRDVLATRAFTRKVEEMPGLSPTRIIRKQHGLPGYKVRRSRTIFYGDGTDRTVSNIDVYPPVVEEYVVAPGADLAALLPPLPANASDEDGAGWVPVGAERDEPAAAAATAACTGDCPRPKIVDSPGAHAPTSQQLRAPARVVIGGP